MATRLPSSSLTEENWPIGPAVERQSAKVSQVLPRHPHRVQQQITAVIPSQGATAHIDPQCPGHG